MKMENLFPLRENQFILTIKTDLFVFAYSGVVKLFWYKVWSNYMYVQS